MINFIIVDNIKFENINNRILHLLNILSLLSYFDKRKNNFSLSYLDEINKKEEISPLLSISSILSKYKKEYSEIKGKVGTIDIKIKDIITFLEQVNLDEIESNNVFLLLNGEEETCSIDSIDEMKYVSNIMKKIKSNNEEIIALYIHEPISIDFIRTSIERIKVKGNKKIIVFTTNTDWFNNNVHLFTTKEKIKFIISSLTDIQNIMLLSLCDYFILSMDHPGIYINRTNRENVFIYKEKIDVMCISLVRAKNRREYSKKKLDLLFNNNWSFFNAIDKKEIEIKEQINNNLIKIEAKKDDEKIEFYHNPSFRPDKKMSKGEFGCALSHYFIYKSLLSSTVLIFEDDFDFDEECKEEINNYLSNLPNPETYDICLFMKIDHLGWFKFNPIERINDYYMKLRPQGFATARSYVITKRGVNKLLKLFENDGKLFINLPADDILSICCQNKYIDVIVSNKLFFGQAKVDSEIWSDGEVYTDVKW
jgi:GR25 family glycosyltransferase involved in LPS biosynthesis